MPPTPLSSMRLRPALVLVPAALLAACATTESLPQRPGGAPGASGPGGTAPGTAPGAPATPGSPAASPLVTEQRFLESWFRGTPVQIAAQPPQQIQIDVPLVHCFDAGKADVKPALNAVLDRVAESLRRQANGRLLVSAPADSAAASALAQARGQKIRDLLTTKGIAATRVTLPEAPPRVGGALQLRLTLPAAAAGQPQVRAPATPAPAQAQAAGGIKPVSTARPAGWTEPEPKPKP